MSAISKERVTITSPAGVAASLPALVGFEPQESVVAVFLKQDQVVVCMRTDIPSAWNDVSEQLRIVADRVGAEALILTICGARGTGDLPFQNEVALVVKDLARTSINVNAAMLVDGAHYWQYGSESEPVAGDLCSRDGVMPALEMSALGVEAPAASREEVVGRYALRKELEPSGALIDQVSQSLSPDPKVRASVAWDAVCTLAGRNGAMRNSPDSESQGVVLMIAVTDVHVRDHLLGGIASDPDPMPLVEVVVETALRAPLDLRPKMAGMAAALLAAFNPSSVPASCLAELAGSDSLADLVLRSIGSAIPPSEIRDLLVRSLPLANAQLEGGRA